MYIDIPHIPLKDYVPLRDASLLNAVLHSVPEDTQNFVEITSDGVKFVDSYLETARSVQIVPVKGDSFGTSNVVNILNQSVKFFGESTRLAGRIRGQLDGGIVLGATDHETPRVIKGGRSFRELLALHKHLEAEG